MTLMGCHTLLALVALCNCETFAILWFDAHYIFLQNYTIINLTTFRKTIFDFFFTQGPILYTKVIKQKSNMYILISVKHLCNMFLKMLSFFKNTFIFVFKL